jgi:hypothetical protein
MITEADLAALCHEFTNALTEVHAGDEGGIVCHIVPPDKQEALVVSRP